MRKATTSLAAVFILALTLHVAGRTTSAQLILPPPSGAKVDSLLRSFLLTRLPGATAPAVITYSRMPGATEMNRLRGAGISKGFAMRALPMVVADLNLAQLTAVRSQPGVVSVWGNRVFKTFTNASRPFIGVPQLMADREITSRNVNNPGFPISGRGIGIGYVDTGIDGTQEDLKYGQKTRANVIQPLSHGVIADPLFGLFGISIADMIAGTGFVPPIYIENAPTSDLESGHGTHGAGVAAGTGVNSGGFYGGVAAGAHLIGVNSGYDLGLPLVAIIGAYDYLLVNQFAHNIRVINNSWGSSLDAEGIDPVNPVNVATRAAHDRNIVVVFAAGNAGDVDNAINPYSTMPWTISVAAGEKQGLGTPADFSSRGEDNGTGVDTAGQPADPSAAPNLRPDITAPGVAVISVRAHGISPVMSASGALNNDALNIPPAFLPNYLSSQGTSFACPHVSGVVALMLEADPRLTPGEVATILRQTATPMPFEPRVVGSGYVDAHNAVRKVMGLPEVDHPANLMPPPGGAEIVDPADDQLGTTAQDIISCDFAYDAAAGQIVYTLTLADLSSPAPNSQWTIASNFGAVAVFVSAAVTETGTTTFEYGTITTLPNGTPNQASIGPTDSGAMSGNQIIMRLAVGKVSQAVGSDVVGTTSTATNARAQILVGTSLTGGLLLNSDSATGTDFEVGGSSSASGGAGGGGGQPAPSGFTERLIGTLPPGQGSSLVPVAIRRPTLDATLSYHPANESLTLELLDSGGNVVAVGDHSSQKRILKNDLPAGNYFFRVSGTPIRKVEFVVKSAQ